YYCSGISIYLRKGWCLRIRTGCWPFGQLGQAEVQHLDVAIRPQHYILRLNIAVDHSCLMCCYECTSHLSSNIQGVSQVKALARHKLSKLLTHYMIHRNEVDYIHAINFVDMSHTWMAQCRGSFRLLDKSAELFRVVGKLGIEQLDSDFAMEFGILSKEDLTHPASPEGGENLVG